MCGDGESVAECDISVNDRYTVNHISITPERRFGERRGCTLWRWIPSITQVALAVDIVWSTASWTKAKELDRRLAGDPARGVVAAMDRRGVVVV